MKHDADAVLYDEVCDTPVCTECILTEHCKHKRVRAKYRIAAITQELTETKRKIDGCTRGVENNLQKLEQMRVEWDVREKECKERISRFFKKV
jgi:hypothetical protein